MKKILLLLSFFLIIVNVFGQIHVINTFTKQSINYIKPLGNQYIIGGDGGYISILDSNYNFKYRIPPPPNFDSLGTWVQLSFIAPNHYYLFSPNKTQIFYSKDSGLNWKIILDNKNYFGKEFQIFDTLNAIVLCSFYRSLVTVNGGNSWEPIENTILAPISSAIFGDSIICIGVQNGFRWSTNRGKTWKVSPEYNFPIGAYQNNFHYINEKIIMSVSNNPTDDYFYSYSTDSGNNWVHKAFGRLIFPSDLHFESVSSGFVVGVQNNVGTILLTRDSGKTWKPIITNTNSYFGVIQKANDSTFLIGGANGVLLKLTKNLTVSASSQAFSPKSTVIYPNPFKMKLSIKCKEIEQIVIINLNGQIVMREEINGAENSEIDLGLLSNGLYILELIGKDGNVYREKIVKH
jgi:photosystem II stability/assembly factor-like uncharacterized protein